MNDSKSANAPGAEIRQRAPEPATQKQTEAEAKASNAVTPMGPESPIDPVLALALSKHQGNRDFIVQAEQQVRVFLKQTQRRRLLFPKQRNSYKRLLLHKLADYYRLTHVVVGRERDEIAFYKKNEEDVESVDKVVCVAELVGFEPESGEAEEGGGAGDMHMAAFTRILVKNRDQQQGSADRSSKEGGSSRKRAARHGGATIEQRQAEYERTRAEIFQETRSPDPLQSAATENGASISLRQEPLFLNIQESAK